MNSGVNSGTKVESRLSMPGRIVKQNILYRDQVVLKKGGRMFSSLQINRSLARKPSMNDSGKTLSQETLLREWQEIQEAQQSPPRFQVLYDRYYESIFRFIFRRTADEALSADLCSQVFLKAMQKLSKYTYKGVPFSAWLFRIASNEIGQYFRSISKNRVVSLEDAHLQEMVDEMDQSNMQDMQNLMIKALDQLKADDLEIIELRFFEQRPYKEIADLMDISVSNAKVKVHRILMRLKKQLNG